MKELSKKDMMEAVANGVKDAMLEVFSRPNGGQWNVDGLDILIAIERGTAAAMKDKKP